QPHTTEPYTLSLHDALPIYASTREECMVERPRSNTPLQALVLLNDPTYVEAARALAERVMREGGQSADERVEFAYRQVLQRKARDRKSTRLNSSHDQISYAV